MLLDLCRLLLPTLVLAWSQAGHSRDFDERLDRLEQLTYSASPAEIQSFVERMESALDTANTSQRTRFTLLRARAAAVARRNDEAMTLLDNLLARRERLSAEAELRALTLAANLLIVSNRFEAGFQYYRDALELAPGIESPAARAHTWSVAAGFHTRIGEHATAIEYANRALGELARDVAPRVHCIALERRARPRLAMGKTDAAIRDYRDALKLCERIPDLAFAGLVHLGLANALWVRGETNAAEQHFVSAIEKLSHMGFVDGEFEARTRLAELMLEQRRIDESRRAILPVMEILDGSGNLALKAAAFEVQARLAALAGDHATLYENMRSAIEFEQQHSIRVRRMRFTMLMSAHDDDARKAEIRLLRSRNALVELDGEANRQQELALTYGGVGGVAAGILLFGLLIKTARERRRMQRLSQRDGLTGLLNHTCFFELAQQAFQRARQNAVPFSLIIADVDLFKQVNDEFGHLVGDSVLARIGERLQSAFENNAIIGRLGGEEFGVALSDCDIDSAVARIEHLRAILHSVSDDDEEPAITMSFGVAELNREPTLDVLYAHADQALYDAKDAGRNRVVTVARIDPGGSGILT